MVSGCSNQQCRIFGGLCFLFLYWRFFLTPSSHTGLWQQQVKWDFSCLSVSPLAWRADSTRQPASPVTALKWKHSSFLSGNELCWSAGSFVGLMWWHLLILCAKINRASFNLSNVQTNKKAYFHCSVESEMICSPSTCFISSWRSGTYWEGAQVKGGNP